MPNATTPAQYILILIDMVQGPDCQPEQLLAGTTLARTGISNIGARIGDTDFSRLVANAQALTGDPALGLKLGLRVENMSKEITTGRWSLEDWLRFMSRPSRKCELSLGSLMVY